MKYYAGLDIGGTVARMKIEYADGRAGEFYGAGGTMNTDGYEKCNAKYRSFILPILEEAQIKAEDCVKICVAARFSKAGSRVPQVLPGHGVSAGKHSGI